MNLRPYQTDCLDAIEKAVARGLRRLLVALPTGTGKTVIFSHLIQQRAGRALVLAHRDELIEQAAEKILQVAPGSDIGVVKGSRNETTSRIIVASIQTVSRERRLEQLRDFSTIIVDEAHHAAAETYRRVLTELGAFAKDGPLTVGFTATADRGDKQGLHSVFEEIAFTRGILEMIQAGYLSDIRAIQLRLDVDFRRLHTRHGDFIDTEVEDLLLTANIEKYGVEAYQQHASERKALLFTPTVALAHKMAAAFNRAGIPAASIDGTTDIDIRRRTLAELKAGRIRVLANCMVLTEGFDGPSVDCILMARPTQSRPLYQQIIGRGLRLHPGKDDCLVLDFVGVTTSHDLVTTASLFGVDAKFRVFRIFSIGTLLGVRNLHRRGNWRRCAACESNSRPTSVRVRPAT
jgi:ATP-dependent helicase IRC3